MMVPTCPKCGCVQLYPSESTAEEAGAPEIEDVLSKVQLDRLSNIALAADSATEFGAMQGDIGHNQVVNLFRTLLEKKPNVNCQVVYHQDGDDSPMFVTAFVGNGPKARETARLYAHAKEGILALVLHARAKQLEVDGLRMALSPFTNGQADKAEEGGPD